MNGPEFMESKWVRAACDPGARAQIISQFSHWTDGVGCSDLVVKARRLKEYLTSNKCSNSDLILVVAALLYLISPLDGVPDFIPFFGWLDDVAVAAMVLGYLDRKAAIRSAQQFEG
jgi:hypothetical protein